MTVYIVTVDKTFNYISHHIEEKTYVDSVFSSVDAAFDRIDILFERFIWNIIYPGNFKFKTYKTLKCVKTDRKFEYSYKDYLMIASEIKVQYNIIEKQLNI